MQSAAVTDPASNCHWLSQERLVAVAQSGKPNSDWLMSVWWADSGEAWRLSGLAPRQGRLVEEEELVAEVEVSVDSSGGILKEARVVQVWVEG